MFDNIGSKIKILAKVVCWIGILASIILGMVYCASNSAIGILFAIGGALLSWVGSFALYGLGQLVENSDIIAAQSARINKKYDAASEKEERKCKNKRNKKSKKIF